MVIHPFTTSFYSDFLPVLIYGYLKKLYNAYEIRYFEFRAVVNN